MAQHLFKQMKNIKKTLTMSRLLVLLVYVSEMNSEIWYAKPTIVKSLYKF